MLWRRPAGRAELGESPADWRLAARFHDDSGHTWHHPDPLHVSIVMSGGDPTYNGGRPGFAGALMDDQMTAILDFMKSGWNRERRECQRWLTVTTQGTQP